MEEITINKVVYTYREGSTILTLLQDAGIALPSLFFDPCIKTASSCRLCLVRIKPT